jgi:hypothetical protein
LKGVRFFFKLVFEPVVISHVARHVTQKKTRTVIIYVNPTSREILDVTHLNSRSLNQLLTRFPFSSRRKNAGSFGASRRVGKQKKKLVSGLKSEGETRTSTKGVLQFCHVDCLSKLGFICILVLILVWCTTISVK